MTCDAVLQAFQSRRWYCVGSEGPPELLRLQAGASPVPDSTWYRCPQCGAGWLHTWERDPDAQCYGMHWHDFKRLEPQEPPAPSPSRQ